MSQQFYDTSNPSDRVPIAAGVKSVYGGLGGAYILIAASNASTAVKRKADYVCTGTNDLAVLQAAINALPIMPDFVRSLVIVTGGRSGVIQLSEGLFNFGDLFTLPAGGTFFLRGAGISSWRVGDPSTAQWEGGTVVYSTNPNGIVLSAPQYTGNRSDTGVPNTIPATAIWMSGIDFRVFNPSTTQNVAAISLVGWQAGVIEGLNLSADMTVNATRRISKGFDVQTGARSDRKTLQNIGVSNFLDAAYVINTTHLYADRLVANQVSGNTTSCGFQISPDQNCSYRNLHVFGCTVGIKTSGGLPLIIDSIQFESCATPVLIQAGTCPVYIASCWLNSDITWAGDLANNCVIERLIKNSSPLLRSRAFGIATILSGQTAVTFAHNLIAAPKTANAMPQSAAGAGARVTADATNLTITVASAVGADTPVYWEAKAA